MYRTYHEARQAFAADRAHLLSLGVVLPAVTAYLPKHYKVNSELAMDEIAQDANSPLFTAPNAGIPSVLTTMIDPEVIRIIFSPNEAANILGGEVKKGSWVDDTIMFPVVESTGEVSSYDDYSNNGSTGVNVNWPQRQNYIFQTIKQYGERELERAGLAKINWVNELDLSAATVLSKYQNFSYFFGILGLQNYGLLNNPQNSAALTPAPKAYGNSKWVTAGVVTASANEVYQDVQTLFGQLVAQSGGVIKATDPLVLAISPGSDVAMTATNSFGINVGDLLKKNFPNLKVMTAVQYAERTSSNPQGVAGGNFAQMIAPTVDGQKTGFAAYSEKLRSHAIVKELSAFKQKISAGTWGTVIRQPFALSAMIGI